VIACAECRAKLDAQPTPWDEPTVVRATPAPWRCRACRSGERRYRPDWGDWVCAFCHVIVAGPEETERPWHLSGPRTAGTPLAGQDRQGHGAIIVRWSHDLRGWIAATDPDTGETVEIPYKEAPAVWQATVRSRRGVADGHD